MKSLLLSGLGALLLTSTGAPAVTAPSPHNSIIWQIGRFDHSSHEFQGSFDLHRGEADPVFTVGASTAAKDWPAMQPGSANPAFGGQPHPFTIHFQLSGLEAGSYRLKIGLITSSQRIPRLEVMLNGHRGDFFIHRRMSFYPGNPGLDSPIYGEAQLQIVLPSRDLQSGGNTLVLTAMDQPEDGPGNSSIAYDAVQLRHDADQAAPVRAELEPTIYFVRKNGQLQEQVDLAVTLDHPVRRGEAVVKLGDTTLREALSSQSDFGEQRFRLALPAWTGTQPATVSLALDGRKTTFHASLQAQRRWTMFVVPHAHLDIGFTDLQAKVGEVHDRNIDKLLSEIRQHPAMRFSLDGSWIAQQYLQTRSATAQKDFLDRVRQGQIGVPAEYANLLTGYPSLEDLIREHFYTLRLHRADGIPFDYANITDVPSYTWSYASVLHALGIRYFAAASNNDRAPVLMWGRWNTQSPFWWEGPDGGKVLMSYSRQYFQLSFICGVPHQMAACRQSLPTFFQQYEAPDYKPDAVLLYGSQVENTDLIPGEPQFVQEWNRTYAYPVMKLATFPDYFRYIDQHFGPQLKTVKGDFGPYWEDGLGTDARFVALDRGLQQRATSAEELSTLTTFLDPNLASPTAQLHDLWRNLALYAEHTFTSWGGYSRPRSEESVQQLRVKDDYARQSRDDVSAIAERSLSQLAARIHVAEPAVIVFNPLSWQRSGLVEIDLDHGKALQSEPDGATVPFELLRGGNGYDHIRFLARDVPSLGYRVYRIVNASPAATEAAGTIPETIPGTMENAFYRVRIDSATGAITSIFDKQLGKELVASGSPYHMDQYLYVSGGDQPSQLVYLQKSLPYAHLQVTPAAALHPVEWHRTPYGQVLTLEGPVPHGKLRTEIILFDQQKKIEFLNHLDKEKVPGKEAIYFAFPFHVDHPSFRYQIQNGSVDPARDILQGGNREWFTVQDWVRVGNPQLAVAVTPLDAPLITLGDIDRGTWPKSFEPRSSTVFSFAINNYWHTDFRHFEEGPFTFRYVITSGSTLGDAQLSSFGKAEMTPLEAGQLIHNDKMGDPAEPLTTAPTSFLHVDAADVQLVNWKAAEDGNGTILRLVETGGTPATIHLSLPEFVLHQAWQANAAEENQQSLPVTPHELTVPVKPYEILTLRIVASSPLSKAETTE